MVFKVLYFCLLFLMEAKTDYEYYMTDIDIDNIEIDNETFAHKQAFQCIFVQYNLNYHLGNITNTNYSWYATLAHIMLNDEDKHYVIKELCDYYLLEKATLYQNTSECIS